MGGMVLFRRERASQRHVIGKCQIIILRYNIYLQHCNYVDRFLIDLVRRNFSARKILCKPLSFEPQVSNYSRRLFEKI